MLCGINSTGSHPHQPSLSGLVPSNIIELIEERPITMLPIAKSMTPEALRELFPNGKIYACDFYVEGIEKGAELPYGFELDGIVNIDHHAPVRSMSRRVSSGNLALEFVRRHGPLEGDAQIVIHHLDCDSFVSSLIMRGILPADDRWGDAVIAADHTGEENPFADLLQALSGERDIRRSAENLLRLSRGLTLDVGASAGLAERTEQRVVLRDWISSGILKKDGGVTWFLPERDIDGELLISMIPDAVVIMLAIPFHNKPGVWVNRMRLGASAPEGMSLLDLNIGAIDQNWGGRWNAGANNRGGGSPLNPHFYAVQLACLVENYLTRSSTI